MSIAITPEALAEVIRRVDGKHALGAAALADAILAALPELLAAQPDRAAEYDDAASATPTDAEILSSLRGLYASDAAAAMAAEDDVRTVRAFLARRKNYAFPPAAAVPKDVQRDAERYRWLRNESSVSTDSDPVVVAATPCCVPCLFGSGLDEDVDAAMAAAQAPEVLR
ncbi:hypothetical protein [Xanthomonas translucens]|uniref:hypothetical protein n=1 Tax=Xanthomonas campestris pv. translucens TaxID=343 RepID=UPI000AE0C850|nr:hypothetical protein [Xanthomonas translucens]